MHFLPLSSTLFQSAEGKGIFVFLSCVGSFILPGFALSLSLSLHMAVWYLEKAQHTLEDQIFGSKMGELDLIILEHQW